MSSISLSWVGSTALRQGAVRAPALSDVIKHPTSWYWMSNVMEHGIELCLTAWRRQARSTAVLDDLESSSLPPRHAR